MWATGGELVRVGFGMGLLSLRLFRMASLVYVTLGATSVGLLEEVVEEDMMVGMRRCSH